MKIQHHLIDEKDLIVIDDAFTDVELNEIDSVVRGLPNSLWMAGHDDNLLRYSAIHAELVNGEKRVEGSVIRGDCVFFNDIPEFKSLHERVMGVIIDAVSTKVSVNEHDKSLILNNRDDFFCRALRYMPGYYDDCAEDTCFLHFDISMGVMFTPIVNDLELQSTTYYANGDYDTPMLTLEHKPGRLVVFNGQIIHAPSKCFEVPRYAMSLHCDSDINHLLSEFRS